MCIRCKSVAIEKHGVKMVEIYVYTLELLHLPTCYPITRVICETFPPVESTLPTSISLI